MNCSDWKSKEHMRLPTNEYTLVLGEKKTPTNKKTFRQKNLEPFNSIIIRGKSD